MKKDVLVYFDLVTSLKTTQDVEDFTCEIDTFMSVLSKSEKVSAERALSSISTDSAKKITQTFSKNDLNINDRNTVADFFNTLKKLLEKFKIIRLVLAFQPTYKTITRIHNFVKDTIGIGYILDIEILDEILGGAIIIFNGKYYDLSLKKNIEDTFETKGSQILSIVG
jgi:F0F1-type ATP synthase delta subunit